MARQSKQDDMSFAEKHVEKGVLVLCLGLLLFSIWHWALSSPRRVAIIAPGRPARKSEVIEVRPEEVDAMLIKAARLAKTKHENALPVDFKPEEMKIVSDLKRLRQTPFAGGQMIAQGQPRDRLEPYTPPVTGPKEFGMKCRVADLQEVAPAPNAPVTKVSLELVDNAATPHEGLVSHSVTSYSLADLAKIWEGLMEEPENTSPATTQPAKPSRKLKYISLRKYPPWIIGVEIEVRVADDVNADWAAIEPRPLQDTRLPISIAAEGKKPVVLKRLPVVPVSCAVEDRKPVLVALYTIITHMANLTQPPYYNILDPSGQNWDSWYRNLPREPIEVAGGVVTETLRQLEAAGAARGKAGARRRGAPPVRGQAAPPRDDRRGPVPTRRGAPPIRGGGADPARPGGGYDPARPRGGVAPTRPRGGFGPKPTTVDPARGDGRNATGEGEGEGIAVVDTAIAPPAFDAQLQAGNLLIWFHDMNIVPDKAYRYRIRLRLLNPLFNNEPLMYKDDKIDYKPEASTTTIPTPWSGWSKPVQTARQMDFFLVDSQRVNLRAATGKAKVAVFTRRMGQLVANEFTLVEGEAIGRDEVPMLLKNPPESLYAPPARRADGAPEPPRSSEYKVDFSTGAVIVDVNLLKRVFKAGRDTKTAEILFVDAKKKLRSRVQLPDPKKTQSDESPEVKRYKELLAEAQAAAAMARGEAGREDSDGR